MNQSEYPDASISPKGLAWYQTWLKALAPSVQAYEVIAADPDASVGKACLWVFLSSGIMMPFFAWSVGLRGGGAPGESMIAGVDRATVVCVCSVSIASGVVGVLGLLLMSGLSHGIASALLGGTGTFVKLTYAFAAYVAPLTIIGAVISVIPFVNYLNFLVAIYGIVLSMMAVKAVHRLDWGRAFAFVANWAGLLCCVAVVATTVLTLLGPWIGAMWSDIINSDIIRPVPPPASMP
jgi:hypothetical protein